MPQQYTKEDILKVFPKRKNAITDELIEIFNESTDDPVFRHETLLQSAMTYEEVLNTSRYKFDDYVKAIKFCAYLGVMEDNFTDAYKKTFFKTDFVQNRLNLPTETPQYKELTSAASRYRNSRLVTNILTYSQVPEDIFFAGYRIKAAAVLADKMINAKSEKVQVDAAKYLLDATKGSEKVKMTLDVQVKESSAIEQLNEQLAILAAKQTRLLEAGAINTAELGALKVRKDDIIDVEAE